MENFIPTDRKVIVVDPTESGIQLHILNINMPPEPEPKETPDPSSPGNVPLPYGNVPYQPYPPVHAPGAGGATRPGGAPLHGRGQTQVQGYPYPFASHANHSLHDSDQNQSAEVSTTYSHSVLVKDGAISYTAKSDIVDTLKPIRLAQSVLNSPFSLLAYVFPMDADNEGDVEDEGDLKSESVYLNLNVSSVFVNALSVKYGFYDILLAMCYVDRGCDLSKVPPRSHKRALHVHNNLGGGFIIPFEDAIIAHRLANNPHMSHLQHSAAKIILSVLEHTTLNDGELLLINLQTTLNRNDLSKYTVTTELATMSKDMSIQELLDITAEIGIITKYTPAIDTDRLYTLLFGIAITYGYGSSLF
jgi:hypothetical protein